MVNDPNRPTENGRHPNEPSNNGRADAEVTSQTPDDEQIQAILDRRRQAQATRTTRPTLSPGFEAYRHNPGHQLGTAVSRKDHAPRSHASRSMEPSLPGGEPTAVPSTALEKTKRRWGWLMPWRTKPTVATQPVHPAVHPATGEPLYPVSEDALIGTPGAFPVALPTELPRQQRIWERQPYAAIAHILLTTGALTTAWLLGIVVAQVLPGNVERPPFQESVLRRGSRLVSRLWHFPTLWESPTTYRRIEAIPLPETGPVSGPIELSPIEKQPLVDELNAIETEVLTLDRRLESLEKRMGNAPYQGTGIDSRINTLRSAIDPPVRTEAVPEYAPVASESGETLLDVAELSMTLPTDALFAPGDSQLRDTELLEQVLDQLVNYPGATVSIRSHSDDQASAVDSQEYTLEQAIALTAYLRRALPTEHRWIAVGLGQSQPTVDNSDVVNQQRNRRIEILVDTR